MVGIIEGRSSTKSKIINFISENNVTSKVELAKKLNLSMPTVINNVNELITQNIILEVGEYESTGGRKAKSIGINKDYNHAVGLVITANHLEMVLVNMGYEVEKIKRVRLKFSTELSYCNEIKKSVTDFVKECENLKLSDLLGIGISIPGIIDQNNCIVLKSHALGIENYSLLFLKQMFDIPVYFENDANAAMLAEGMQVYGDAIYLSLNHTLGGALCLGGRLFRGKNQKAGEFGHMVLVPGGRKCYCGKEGCADAYCAESVLTDGEGTLDDFVNKLKEGEPEAARKWEEYLEHLAILISNLRMAYDVDIILGGDVGGILAEYMNMLGEKVMKYNRFEHDVSYLKICSYKKEASAVGVAKHFFYEYIMQI